MPIPKKVQNYLDKNKIKYDVLAHRCVYTAYDLANTTKKKLSEIAKTLVVKADAKYVLVVLPAHYRLDLSKLKKVLGAKKVSIAPEKVMKKVFNVKPGAITPFGSLHKVEVVVDKALAKSKEALFSAGSFTDSLQMKVKDFVDLEEAKLETFAKKHIPEVIKPPKPAPKKSVKKKSSCAKCTPGKKKK